jgi:hypothetical protein
MLQSSKHDLPGPAQYNAEVIRTKTPQYTLGGKRKETKPADHPGPGHYSNMSDTFQSKFNNSKMGNSQGGPGVGFGTQSRIQDLKNTKSMH